MPIITELPSDSVTSSNIVERGGPSDNQSQGPSNSGKLKQWMHLNHILNCKTTSCQTYKMVRCHLLKLHKIDKNDFILIPVDYQVTSYSDAVLTITCTSVENCNICSNLLDHLSCHKRYCDCNNYRDICYNQLHLRHSIEKLHVPGKSFVVHNMQCTTPTKRKIESLGKHHYEVLRVMQGLKNITQESDNCVDTTVGSSDKNCSEHLQEHEIHSNNFRHQSINKCPVNSKNNCAPSKKNFIDLCSTEGENSYLNNITPYGHQTFENISQCYDSAHGFALSDESLIGSSDEHSDFEEAAFTRYDSDLVSDVKLIGHGSKIVRSKRNPDGVTHVTNSALYDTTGSLKSCSSAFSDSNMCINLDSESDSSVAIEFDRGCPDILSDDSNSEDADCNVVFPDISTRNHHRSSQKMPQNHYNITEVTSDINESVTHNHYDKSSSFSINIIKSSYTKVFSLFSDEESYLDNSNDSSSDDILPAFQQKPSCFKKRKYQSIRKPLLSDECVLEDSDEDDMEGLFNFTDSMNTNCAGNPHFNVTDQSYSVQTDESCARFRGFTGVRSYGIEDISTGSIATTSIQDTTEDVSQSVGDTTQESQYLSMFASTPLHTAAFRCKGHSSDCWYCGTVNSASNSISITDTTLPESCIDMPKPILKKPVHKPASRRRRLRLPKIKRPRKKVKPQNKQRTDVRNVTKLKAISCNAANREDIFVAENRNQRRAPANIIAKSPFSDINYSYVRNVLSQSNTQAQSSNQLSDKRKNQTIKKSPPKKSKKMKLYDTSTWIESSNYYQLCHSNLRSC